MKIDQLLESSNQIEKQVTSVSAGLIPKWTKSGLLEGAAMERTANEKQHMAILLENQIKQVMFETMQTNLGGANFTVGNGEQWAGVVLPMVRKVFGQISAKEFMATQPLQLPTGLVFYLDFKYANQQPYIGTGANSRFNAGDSLYGITNVNNVASVGGLYGAGRFGYGTNKYLATAATSSLTAATASFADVDYNAAFSASAAANGLRKVTIATASAVLPNVDTLAVRSFTFTGSGISESNLFAQFTSYNLTNDTLTFIVSGSIVTNPATAIVANPLNTYYTVQTKDNFRGDYETRDASPLTGSAAIPAIDLAPLSKQVAAKTKKLQISYTQEAETDYQAYQSINLEQEATSILSDHISREVDLELLDMIDFASEATTEVWSAKSNREFDKVSGAFVDSAAGVGGYYHSKNEWFQTLYIKMEKVSKSIHAKTQMGEANVVTCGPNAAVVLESMNGFSTSGGGVKMEYYGGAKESGKLNQKYKIIVNPYLQEDIILMGFKGSSYLESGAVYCPYVPIVSTPLIFNPDTYKKSKMLSTRFAKALLRPEFYGKIYLADTNLV